MLEDHNRIDCRTAFNAGLEEAAQIAEPKPDRDYQMPAALYKMREQIARKIRNEIK